MKKSFYLFFLVNIVLIGYAYGFDMKGIQPIMPYGVFSTFSAESLKKNDMGFGLGLERSRQPDFYRLTAQLAYGINNNMEVGLTLPYITKWHDSIDGVEDISVGFKHRFFDEDRYGPSIAYLLSVSMPSGREEFSTEGSMGGGIIISKRVGPVNGHANIFYSRPFTERFNDDITFSAGLDFSAANNFKILGELYGKKSYSGKLDRLELRLGYRIHTTDSLFTTIGAGFDLKNRSPEYRLILSLTYILSSEEKKIRKIYEEEN